mgnify:FL=1
MTETINVIIFILLILLIYSTKLEGMSDMDKENLSNKIVKNKKYVKKKYTEAKAKVAELDAVLHNDLKKLPEITKESVMTIL